MSSPHPDELVEVTLDQPRHLFFNLRALRALDRAMGEAGIGRALELLRALNFATLERVLWAGMLHEEPTLTVSLVQKRLETFTDAGGNATDLYAAAYKALNGSRVFGPPEGEVKPEPVEAK